jgi:hypothetical protein
MYCDWHLLWKSLVFKQYKITIYIFIHIYIHVMYTLYNNIKPLLFNKYIQTIYFWFLISSFWISNKVYELHSPQKIWILFASQIRNRWSCIWSSSWANSSVVHLVFCLIFLKDLSKISSSCLTENVNLILKSMDSIKPCARAPNFCLYDRYKLNKLE